MNSLRGRDAAMMPKRRPAVQSPSRKGHGRPSKGDVETWRRALSVRGGPVRPKDNEVAPTSILEGERPMRVMVMVKATAESEAGAMPSSELLEAMGKYNEELIKAGVMLAGEGLHPSAKGKRVAFDGLARTVMDGPFAETREVVAGFWLW